ncbi:aldolase catalytic domain-containing protein [Pseudomonas nitroreducens]|uniref:aldolase catalytic domain-containing protein n=1 Tax=Pseudomonas nitroreducens TaxID=46680 RepID=UPI0028A68379|nr:aldolase catalytic domain-containing protein [Pseudomonas nitroreducens]
MSDSKTFLLDCTLRDGGYYNNWDFDTELVHDYLQSMAAAGIDYVELGLRGFARHGFRGGYAYSSDAFLSSLPLVDSVCYGVMVNASELVQHEGGALSAAKLLFAAALDSPVGLVRIASHAHEFEAVLPACQWLMQQGYKVGINLMQIAEQSDDTIVRLAQAAQQFDLDVLYFADSMGSLSPGDVRRIIGLLRQGWKGALGIHAHDNRALAHANTLEALDAGATWLDGTVLGMGRGPGNARTEYLALQRGRSNLSPLLQLVAQRFQPMQQRYGWGTSPYYYLAGQHGIHPTYVQEMLADSRYSNDDLLVAIQALRSSGGKKYNPDTLEASRHFYHGEPHGEWAPRELLEGREVLLLGSGEGVARHREAIEQYIRKSRPVVLALNTQADIAPELIDLRAACHPLRLMADCQEHLRLPQPLITPAGMLPVDVRNSLDGKALLDFGLAIDTQGFGFNSRHCTLPTSLVAAYALAVAASGKAQRVLLAGFDGYPGEDPRNAEVNDMLELYQAHACAPELLAVTPTRYQIPCSSIYAL